MTRYGPEQVQHALRAVERGGEFPDVKAPPSSARRLLVGAGRLTSDSGHRQTSLWTGCGARDDLNRLCAKAKSAVGLVCVKLKTFRVAVCDELVPVASEEASVATLETVL